MTIVDRILLVYYGPFLSGRHASVAHATNTHPLYADRLRGVFDVGGLELDLFFQITRFRSFLGTATFAEMMADPKYGDLERNGLRGELEGLRRASGIVFVADPANPEATRLALGQLRLDLEEAESDPDDTPVVFQLNKQDLVASGAVEPLDRSMLSWPIAAFVETVASRGEGVSDALERVVELALEGRRRRRARAPT